MRPGAVVYDLRQVGMEREGQITGRLAFLIGKLCSELVWNSMTIGPEIERNPRCGGKTGRRFHAVWSFEQ
jgi:hypothetical protein